jgi:protein-S-isoprenylcysteine O-methyltransferase
MIRPDTAFLALSAIWVASEIWIGRKRAADGGKAHDRGSLQILHVAIWGSIFVAVWMSRTGLGLFDAHLLMPLFRIGCAMMIAGMGFRWWAVRVLDRYFTIDVGIREDHRLIRSGPYRLLRHPSYTGSLLTFYGFALALGSLWSLALIVVVVTAAFLWRIRVEERALTSAFPRDYPAYARETKRLIPFVW